MLGRVQPQKSFGDEALEMHVSDTHFLVKVDRLVDWSVFDAYWPKLYGTTGKPSSDPLVCFKMLLLEQWYDLSDPACEAQCADRLSFRRFLGLSLTDTVPDETVLVRFRKRLVKAGLAEKLFDRVLKQLESAGVIVKRGTLVDATIVPSARKAPVKGEDGRPTGGDSEASWAVKGDKPIAHGFKAHVAVDEGSEIVRAIKTTTGATHDAVPADRLIEQAPAKAVYADAAYCDKERRKKLRGQGIFARIRFNPRNGELTTRQRALNIRWARVRAQVEHVFADWKQRRSLARCRYVGLKKNTLHFTLLAIAHNLRRWSVLAA
jgi:IS5 family transposase